MFQVQKGPILTLPSLMKDLCGNKISRKTGRTWVIKVIPNDPTHALYRKFKCHSIQPNMRATINFRKTGPPLPSVKNNYAVM